MQRGLVGSEMCIRDRSTQSTWDGRFHIFSSLLPRVLHSVDFKKPTEGSWDQNTVYHDLRCESCKEAIGKHYVISSSEEFKKYEDKYCFPKECLTILDPDHPSPCKTAEELKGEIVTILSLIHI
eukprot:TRINITY_DN53567_c0_g1_i2.p2 TRINITY_DN53567_c0_g1~~TRINITY_DN53567_c0_g1_i2.p2  ORF type:complete len:124 (+),score=23.62 TRINITY_DN53567_c0_g1_i2:119-490(+)